MHIYSPCNNKTCQMKVQYIAASGKRKPVQPACNLAVDVPDSGWKRSQQITTAGARANFVPCLHIHRRPIFTCTTFRRCACSNLAHSTAPDAPAQMSQPDSPHTDKSTHLSGRQPPLSQPSVWPCSPAYRQTGCSRPHHPPPHHQRSSRKQGTHSVSAEQGNCMRPQLTAPWRHASPRQVCG